MEILPSQEGPRRLEAQNYVSELVDSLVHRRVWRTSSGFHPAYIKIKKTICSVRIVLRVFPPYCFWELDYVPLYPACADEGGGVSVSVYTRQTPVGHIKY